MPLICLFGSDGSGKTTLAKALARELEDHGFNVRISWMRGTHTLASPLARFLSRFTLFRESDNPYYGISGFSPGLCERIGVNCLEMTKLFKLIFLLSSQVRGMICLNST